MSEVPGMDRPELLHPLVVHFPIALLLLVTFVYVLRFTPFGKHHQDSLAFAGRLVLFPGVVLAWIAFYTGGIADGEVGRTLCDPTVAKSHEQTAALGASLFSLLAAGELLLLFFKDKRRQYARLIAIAGLVLSLAGAGTLGYTGHLGAKLVYQQAAGVYQPSTDCSEFE